MDFVPSAGTLSPMETSNTRVTTEVVHAIFPGEEVPPYILIFISRQKDLTAD